MNFKKPKFWDYQRISFWSVILLPFSVIYLAVIWVVQIYLKLKVYKKPSIPVICVGNVYLGGTGKTPLVREIYNITKSLGKNPAFIKKHYDYLTDEIEMLNASGKTFTYNSRLKSIFSSQINNHNLAIMDDGFQDFSIKPDFSILCFSSKQMIGNGLVIPSGPLRENMGSILRADCIVINGVKNLEFEKKLYKKMGKKNLHIFYAKYKIKDIDKFKNKEITAFAGIGNPVNFFDLLKENDLNVKNKYSFPDHHNYSEEDFKKIRSNKETQIVTTEKDYYRISDTQKKFCECVKVDLEIENKDQLLEIIKTYL